MPENDAGSGSRRLKRPNTYIVANLVLWALTYAVVTARVWASPETVYPADLALRRLVLMAGGFCLCLLIGKVLGALSNQPLSRRLVAALFLSAIGAFVYVASNWAMFNLVWPRWPTEPPALIGMAVNASIFIWTFICWCALYLAISYEAEAKEKTVRLLSAQALAMDAQNRMLRYQINPHFLFNTLNALSALILARETDRAERVVLSLSSFLRYTLEKDLLEKVPLGEELKAQMLYLGIEQARFEDRLRVVENVPQDLRTALTPSLILQPLVENAVKYGVARSLAPVTVSISAEAADGRLALTVRDDGQDGAAAEPPKLGLGLQNVRRRLEAIYGDRAELRCGPREPRGFQATIVLPLERA